MNISTLPHIRGERYRAVKDSVRTRCTSLRLCDDATRRCVDRAAALLREGHSAACAISDGIALAKRLAGLRSRQPETAA